ncbi:unnamed protein product [Diabrotica balteata]|uniref:Reverse transcriptase domain-containing protein n=1 Tax=Diabrotica balteata TaxID=107213 RepID=A0A9N9SQS8_DIABA|nr:unnamed protein product [Diabrotica balteata]
MAMVLPELYNQCNDLTVSTTKDHLSKYKHLIKWKNEESIMELGVGDGNCSMYCLQPFLPNHYKEFVAMDISEAMLEYAKNNINLPNTRFVQCDVGSKDIDDEFIEKFDHIFSFYCIHMIENIRTKGNNYPKEIRELIVEKRKLRKKWQQYRAPRDKTSLNNATQKLKREIQNTKNSTINYFLSNITADQNTDYSLWKATKRLKRPIIHSPPIKLENGNWARNQLKSTFKPNDNDSEELRWEEPFQTDERITLTSLREVSTEIKENINPKKAPGYDLITGELLKNLPRKAIVKLTHLINAALRLRYILRLWKVAEVIMIAKPGKSPNEVTSYRPISLLPVMSKLFEKLLLKRLKPIIERKNLIPNHQFGFRNQHSTKDQVHRITNIIEKTLEENKVCSTIFLDVAQAFDKVRHDGLNYKLRRFMPKQCSEILKSYFANRYFRVKQEEVYTDLREIKAGVPQGSVLGPELEQNTIATFADDTAILAIRDTSEEATDKLQLSVNKIHNWTRKWRIKLNETKSAHINFTNKK